MDYQNMNYQIDEDLSRQILYHMDDSVNDCKITKQEIMANDEVKALLIRRIGIDPEIINIQDIDIDGGICNNGTDSGTCQNGVCIPTPPSLTPPPARGRSPTRPTILSGQRPISTSTTVPIIASPSPSTIDGVQSSVGN